jgi:hypothetical protein
MEGSIQPLLDFHQGQRLGFFSRRQARYYASYKIKIRASWLQYPGIKDRTR